MRALLLPGLALASWAELLQEKRGCAGYALPPVDSGGLLDGVRGARGEETRSASAEPPRGPDGHAPAQPKSTGRRPSRLTSDRLAGSSSGMRSPGCHEPRVADVSEGSCLATCAHCRVHSVLTRGRQGAEIAVRSCEVGSHEFYRDFMTRDRRDFQIIDMEMEVAPGKRVTRDEVKSRRTGRKT